MLLGLARGGIRPVTMKTVFRQDWADLVVVGDRFTGGRGGAHTGKNCGYERQTPCAFADQDIESPSAKAVYIQVWRTTQRNHDCTYKRRRVPQ
jgi:hypothetical protein